MNKLLFALVGTLVWAFACQKKAPENCSYAYQAKEAKLTWTAYKFVKKAGVSGTFGTIRAEGAKKADTAGGVFSGLSFSIPTKSVNSNNPPRDKKIADSFFGTMADTASISGKVIQIDAANEGKATVRIRLNGKEKEVPFSFQTKEDGTFEASASIDMKDWDALPAVAALNKVCSEKHSDGADGVSKLWPDVDLKITSKLEKSCK